MTVEPGIYKHFKGNMYRVIGIGRHTETTEDMVIYQAHNEVNAPYWIRPYSMFIDSVIVNGETQPRFSEVNEDSEQAII